MICLCLIYDSFELALRFLHLLLVSFLLLRDYFYELLRLFSKTLLDFTPLFALLLKHLDSLLEQGRLFLLLGRSGPVLLLQHLD